MSDSPDGQPAALPLPGWYTDPLDPLQERWWSGVQWMELVQSIAPAPAQPPLPPAPPPTPHVDSSGLFAPVPETSNLFAPVPEISGLFAPVPEAPGLFAPVPETSGLFAPVPEAPSAGAFAPPAPEPDVYRPMASFGTSAPTSPTYGSGYSAGAYGNHGSPNTPGIWLLALTPLLVGLTEFFFIQTYPTINLAWGLGALVVLYPLPIVFAFLDSVELKKRGLPAASPWWTLLGLVGFALGALVFLIIRHSTLRKFGVRSYAPSNVWVLAWIACLAIVVPTLYQKASQVRDTAVIHQLETNIVAELTRDQPGSWAANCPDDAPVSTVGATFTCTVTAPNGVVVRIKATVTTPDHFSFTQDGAPTVGT